MYRIVCHFLIFKLFFTACNSQEESYESSKVRPVKALKVSTLTNIQQKYPGTVEATEKSNLAFKLSGKIIQMNVQTGQKVKKGEVIAQLLNKEYQLLYETTQNNYETSRKIYERNQRLLNANAIAVQEVEIAKANYLQAEEAMRIAKNNLAQTILKAPYNGFIEKKEVELFDEIQAGESVVRLVNPAELEVHFILPETAFQFIESHTNIQIEFDRIEKRFTAKIKEYVNVSNGTGIPVILKITDEQFLSYRHLILPGFSCQVIWESENKYAGKFLIPTSAIQKQGNKEFIWLINPYTLTVYLQEIKTLYNNNHTIVKSGLKTGDIMIAAGGNMLKEGQKVRVYLK